MTEKKKFYLSKEGLNQLRKEYRQLKNIKAEKFREGVPPAWDSENLSPEYITFKEEEELLEGKLLEIEQVLGNYVIIGSPRDKNIVDLGATVVLSRNGREEKFEIVGSLESNPSLRRISIDSLIGKAIFKKRVGDICHIGYPIRANCKILKIKYRSC